MKSTDKSKKPVFGDANERKIRMSSYYSRNGIIGGPPLDMPSPKGWKGRLANAQARRGRHENQMELVAIRRPFVILSNLLGDVSNAEHNLDIARAELERLRGSLDALHTMSKTGKIDARNALIRLRGKVERQEESFAGAENKLAAARDALAAHERAMALAAAAEEIRSDAEMIDEAPGLEVDSLTQRSIDDIETDARQKLEINPEDPVASEIIATASEIKARETAAEPVRRRGRPRKSVMA